MKTDVLAGQISCPHRRLKYSTGWSLQCLGYLVPMSTALFSFTWQVEAILHSLNSKEYKDTELSEEPQKTVPISNTLIGAKDALQDEENRN